MNFIADSHFLIGKRHINSGMPCQDYALSSICRNSAIAIITDGCSLAGPYTDVGARILAFSTAKALQEYGSTSNGVGDTVPLEINIRQRLVMAGSRETLGLSQNDMMATCIYQYMTPDGGLVHIQGDGVYAQKERDGRITMFRYDWMPDDEGRVRPFYPAYAVDNYKSYIEAHGGDIAVYRLTMECWVYTPGKEYSQLTGGEFTLGEGIRGITIPLSREDLMLLDYSAIFSDGVTQIEGIDWKDAVVGLLSFKIPKGSFAKRRMIMMLKDAQRDGHNPLDDIAYAVVRVIPSQGGDENGD